MQDIHIRWEGPLTFDSLKALSGTTDRGLYQIYGYHALYGSDVLLYIGKSADSFARRVTRERWDLSQDIARFQVYLGRMEGPSGIPDEDLIAHIDIAERMLIKAHLPAYNVQRSFDISEFKGFHVFNWGTFRSLFPEVSGARWSDHFWTTGDRRELGTAIEESDQQDIAQNC